MRKAHLFTWFGGAVAPFFLFGAATAQTANTASALEEIVVTGTRIVRSGFTAPTPTTMMSQEDIHATALANIADVVNQLPQLMGSATPQTSNAQVSVGGGGQNLLNLRGLGSQRTLVLLDGRRVVPTTGTGVTDANNLPSQLIKRVDVVTGGASAAYGSDAVSGVVNFVLDTKFSGIKAGIAGGESSRRDDAEQSTYVNYGAHFADDRFHVLLSASAQKTDGIPGIDPAVRKWFQGFRLLNNPAFISSTATPNVPALLSYPNVNLALAAPGGLITSGPLRGTQFGPGGQVSQFVYGNPVVGQQMSGGQTGDTAYTYGLAEAIKNESLFGRFGYDITDDTSVFVQYLYGRSRAHEPASRRARFLGNLTMNRQNPYIPASVVAALTAANATTFGYGLDSADLGLYEQDNIRKSNQLTFGLEGKIFGSWSWNTYYEYGQTRLTNELQNNLIIGNFRNAIDVITGPNGTPVCRSFATNPACVPLNIFGIGVANPQALPYFTGNSHIEQLLTQQVAEAVISGEPFKLWAGPISLAAGVGYRKERISTPVVDPISLASGWNTGNYAVTAGSFTVKEAFGETAIPLAKDLVWAKSLDLNAAVRQTHYSTSGTVTTWKLGLNYRPLSDVLFRGTRSRDIRAPGLNDLYAGGTSQQQPNALDPKYSNGLIGPFPNAQRGNPNLKPEESDQFGLGGVYQPSWFSGFSVSLDYFHIKIKKGIASVPVQNVINDCFTGIHPEYCSFVTRGPGFVGGVAVPDTVVAFITAPVNLAGFVERGYDLEAGYAKKLGTNSSFVIRSLATHILSSTQDNGLGVIHNIAGENSVVANTYGTTPRWRVNTQSSYTQGPVTASINWRWISAGVLATSFFDTPAGPLSVDNNRVPAVSYVDLGLTYRLTIGGIQLELYGRVSNLLDKDPPVALSTNAFSQQYNPFLYDAIGRYYRAGLRLQF